MHQPIRQFGNKYFLIDSSYIHQIQWDKNGRCWCYIHLHPPLKYFYIARPYFTLFGSSTLPYSSARFYFETMLTFLVYDKMRPYGHASWQMPSDPCRSSILYFRFPARVVFGSYSIIFILLPPSSSACISSKQISCKKRLIPFLNPHH